MKRHPNTDTLAFWHAARDYLHAYLPTVRKLAVKTIQAYRISLECFITYLTDDQHIPREEISFDHFHRDQLKAWLAWMNTEQHYAPRTIG